MRLRSLVLSALFLPFTALACGSEAGGPDELASPADQDDFGRGRPKAPEAPLPPAPPICAEATGEYAATREPSNVLFLYDRSGSMHIVLPSNQTRWQAAKNGFFELLDALPATTTAGLMVFPQGDAPVNGHCGIDASINDVRCNPGWPEPPEADRCDPATYVTDVPSAPLSTSQVGAMKATIEASDDGFYWGTPLASALSAAISAQKASTQPGAKSVILLTDGNPTSCGTTGISNDIQHVVDAAATGLQGNTLVRTFVIGLTDSSRQAAKAENLSPIAVAGGTARAPGCEATNSCFYKLTDANFADDLKQVFEEISLQAFDCTFNLPPATADTDPSLVNVQLTDSNGTTKTVARDPAHQNGWDYLPNGTQIQLYGEACGEMKDEGAKLRIVLGCKTVEQEPAPEEPDPLPTK